MLQSLARGVRFNHLMPEVLQLSHCAARDQKIVVDKKDRARRDALVTSFARPSEGTEVLMAIGSQSAAVVPRDKAFSTRSTPPDCCAKPNTRALADSFG